MRSDDTIAVAVDVARLWEAVNRRMFELDWSAKAVAALLGFSPQVLTDIKQAAAGALVRDRARRRDGSYQPSAAVLLTLAWWLGRDPRDFQVVRRDADAGWGMDATQRAELDRAGAS